jgi:uroporphyrinogen decarboxylase
MTRKDRVIKALRFEAPDMVPYHIGLTAPVRAALIEHFGCADLDAALGNHLMSVSARRAAVWTEERPGYWRDEWGVLWDRTIDTDIGNPTEFVLPEPTLTGYTWPDPRAPHRFASSAKAFEKPDDRFSIASVGHALFERAWIMRGMENILLDMAANPAFLHELLDAICDWNIEVMDGMLAYPFDAVWIGDDWGAQQGLIMGPRYWREFIRPRMARMYKHARDRGRYVFIHCCGDVDEIFDDLVAMGVQVFNPFQPEVMDTFGLAARYKGRLSFWGGISTQKLLPLGTPGEVARETRNIVGRIGAGGGYIAAPAHDIQRDVPLENILAMWEVLSGKARQ